MNQNTNEKENPWPNVIDSSTGSIALLSGPPPVQKRPEQIPDLNLNQIIEQQIKEKNKERKDQKVANMNEEEKNVLTRNNILNSVRIDYEQHSESIEGEEEGD